MMTTISPLVILFTIELHHRNLAESDTTFRAADAARSWEDLCGKSGVFSTRCIFSRRYQLNLGDLQPRLFVQGMAPNGFDDQTKGIACQFALQAGK